MCLSHACITIPCPCGRRLARETASPSYCMYDGVTVQYRSINLYYVSDTLSLRFCQYDHLFGAPQTLAAHTRPGCPILLFVSLTSVTCPTSLDGYDTKERMCALLDSSSLYRVTVRTHSRRRVVRHFSSISYGILPSFRLALSCSKRRRCDIPKVSNPPGLLSFYAPLVAYTCKTCFVYTSTSIPNSVPISTPCHLRWSNSKLRTSRGQLSFLEFRTCLCFAYARLYLQIPVSLPHLVLTVSITGRLALIIYIPMSTAIWIRAGVEYMNHHDLHSRLESNIDATGLGPSLVGWKIIIACLLRNTPSLIENACISTHLAGSL